MITWAQLGLVALVLIGISMALLGALMMFAGGMSDVPSEGKAATQRGCGTVLIGLLALGLAIAGLFGWLS